MLVGVDLIEIDRIEATLARHGERFLHKVFTETELADCEGDVRRLAARWAAKEAVAKALGTGIGEASWREIEIVRGPRGQPALVLHGRAREISDAAGAGGWAISLSHARDYAVAFAVRFLPVVLV